MGGDGGDGGDDERGQGKTMWNFGGVVWDGTATHLPLCTDQQHSSPARAYRGPHALKPKNTHALCSDIVGSCITFLRRKRDAPGHPSCRALAGPAPPCRFQRNEMMAHTYRVSHDLWSSSRLPACSTEHFTVLRHPGAAGGFGSCSWCSCSFCDCGSGGLAGAVTSSHRGTFCC